MYFLFRSLFIDSQKYRKVIELLAKKNRGLTREEIKVSLIHLYNSILNTLIGFPAPIYRLSSSAVSPVATKPHFSITRPEAGLSIKCPLISDLMSVVLRMCSINNFLCNTNTDAIFFDKNQTTSVQSNCEKKLIYLKKYQFYFFQSKYILK